MSNKGLVPNLYVWFFMLLVSINLLAIQPSTLVRIKIAVKSLK